MKLNVILENKASLLKWQDTVMGILPDNFDVALDQRLKGKTFKDDPDELEPRIVVSRNGKELFQLSVDRADNSFFDQMHVYGDNIGLNVRLSASRLDSELKLFMKVFDLRRKLGNLLTGKTVQIVARDKGKHGLALEANDKKTFVTVLIDDPYKATVSKSRLFGGKQAVGTTNKGDDAIIALVEKGFE